jgi:hydroxyacylglutathione hydrolase
MTLDVIPISTGKWRQRCYLVARRDGDALVIDPGGDIDRIVAAVETRGLNPLAILNTHGHFDHIGAVEPLMARFHLPFYLHEGDFTLLCQANLYRLVFESSAPVKIPAVTHGLKDQPEEFDIGPFHLRWLATPGHTHGSVCFHLDQYLFSGDTILSSGAGRTDLPGGDKRLLTESLQRLSSLPEDLIVHAGHGKTQTLGACLALVETAGELAHESKD